MKTKENRTSAGVKKEFQFQLFCSLSDIKVQVACGAAMFQIGWMNAELSSRENFVKSQFAVWTLKEKSFVYFP
jgi:hypothetical protein